LSEHDQLFLKFGERFEQELLQQDGARSLAESMEIGWRLLQHIPVLELTRLSDEQIQRHIKDPLPEQEQAGDNAG